MASTPLHSSALPVLVTMVMVSLTTRTWGFPTGAPNYVCRDMRPLHPGREQTYSPFTFPYTISLSNGGAGAGPGDLVTVTIKSKNSGGYFNGMLATVADKNGRIVPGLTKSSADPLKLLDCTRSQSTVPASGLTHSEKLYTDSVSFGWRVPPEASPGDVYNIRVTVVKNVTIYWVGINNTLTVGRPSPSPGIHTTHVTSPGTQTPGMTSQGTGMTSQGTGMTSQGTGMTSQGTGMTSQGTGMTSIGAGSTSHMPTSPRAGSGSTGFSLFARQQVCVLLVGVLVSVLTWHQG